MKNLELFLISAVLFCGCQTAPTEIATKENSAGKQAQAVKEQASGTVGSQITIKSKAGSVEKNEPVIKAQAARLRTKVK